MIPALATRYDQDSIVPRSPRQRLGPPLTLSRSRATCPPAIDAMFRDPLAPWSLDDGILDSLPKAPPSSQSHPPASGTTTGNHNSYEKHGSVVKT